MPKKFLKFFSVTLLLWFVALSAGAQQTPSVGQHAPNFTLSTLDGKAVSLNASEKKGPVVLVLLRGYPGYQCPFCAKQVHDYLENAAGFAKAGATVMLIYPGPWADLDSHAKDFQASQDALPHKFFLLLDPDYRFAVEYGLRWEKEHETVYPSTFLVNQAGDVVFSKISDEHGGRTTAAELLAELAKLPPR